jgi:hypothetical protein
VRHPLLSIALALCFAWVPIGAAEKYGEWSLEQPKSAIFTLSFKRSIRVGDKIGTSELGFICDQQNKFVRAILIPVDGTYQNHQAVIPVVIQKNADEYDRSDLLQHWNNAIEYIFLEGPEEQEQLATYLEDKEGQGIKSVHFYFPNDLDAGPEILNHVIVDVSGFTEGVAAFQKACEQSQ